VTRRAYRFRLVNGDTGTMLTDEQDPERALAKLEAIYAERLT